jgi:cytochrome c oxidase subunit 3
VQNADWPAEGNELPKLIAGVNTAILISSSFTLHWAEHAHKQGNRRGLQAGMLTTVPARLHLPLRPDQRVCAPRVRAQDHAQGTIFYGLTGLHGAHVFIG